VLADSQDSRCHRLAQEAPADSCDHVGRSSHTHWEQPDIRDHCAVGPMASVVGSHVQAADHMEGIHRNVLALLVQARR
jgi:hypothetical protein